MLTVVDIIGGSGVPLTLPIVGAEDELIQVKDIKGLDPVKAAISTSPYGVIPGVAITGTSVADRNIVLTLGLNPDWAVQTIEYLRLQLYKYFMPQLPMSLIFTSTHLPQCSIDGYVESMEPNLFSEDPEIQVSIICGRPEFTSLEETTLTGLVDTDLASMVEIDYLGSAVSGMELLVQYSSSRATYTGPLTVHLQNLVTTDITFNPVTIDSTHALEMSSVPGNKYVHIPNDPIVNLLGTIQSGYGWPILRPGLNRFGVVASLDGQRWSMSYFTKFGGL